MEVAVAPKKIARWDHGADDY